MKTNRVSRMNGVFINESDSLLNSRMKWCECDCVRVTRLFIYADRVRGNYMIEFVTAAQHGVCRHVYHLTFRWAIRDERIALIHTRVYAIAYECMNRVLRMNSFIHTRYTMHAFIRDCIHTRALVTNDSRSISAIHSSRIAYEWARCIRHESFMNEGDSFVTNGVWMSAIHSSRIVHEWVRFIRHEWRMNERDAFVTNRSWMSAIHSSRMAYEWARCIRHESRVNEGDAFEFIHSYAWIAYEWAWFIREWMDVRIALSGRETCLMSQTWAWHTHGWHRDMSHGSQWVCLTHSQWGCQTWAWHTHCVMSHAQTHMTHSHTHTHTHEQTCLSSVCVCECECECECVVWALATWISMDDSYVRHDSFICVIWLMNESSLTYESTWDIHMNARIAIAMCRSCDVWRESFMSSWEIHMCDIWMIHSYVWHMNDSFIHNCESRALSLRDYEHIFIEIGMIYMWDMTHS